MDAAALLLHDAAEGLGPFCVPRATSDSSRDCARETTRPSRPSTTAITATCSPSAATCSAVARRPRTRCSSSSSRCPPPAAPMTVPSGQALALHRGAQPLPSVLRARRDAVALDDVREPSCDGLAVAAEVERRQDLKAMLADLRDLPDDQRAALLLSELGGLSHDDIGEVLERTPREGQGARLPGAGVAQRAHGPRARPTAARSASSSPRCAAPRCGARRCGVTWRRARVARPSRRRSGASAARSRWCCRSCRARWCARACWRESSGEGAAARPRAAAGSLEGASSPRRS